MTITFYYMYEWKPSISEDHIKSYHSLHIQYAKQLYSHKSSVQVYIFFAPDIPGVIENVNFPHLYTSRNIFLVWFNV